MLKYWVIIRHGVIDNSKDYMIQGNINSNRLLKTKVIVIVIDSQVTVLAIVIYNLKVEVIVIVNCNWPQRWGNSNNWN